ncbi:MAG: hypothetical protein LBS41_00740 [Streptococcaceae bacterium]|jgi:hypothetical protein|nr:hypothetical protein [Streptococcaceae bacterium]
MKLKRILTGLLLLSFSILLLTACGKTAQSSHQLDALKGVWVFEDKSTMKIKTKNADKILMSLQDQTTETLTLNSKKSTLKTHQFVFDTKDGAAIHLTLKNANTITYQLSPKKGMMGLTAVFEAKKAEQ